LANQQEVGIPGFVQRLEAHFGRTVARSVDDRRAIDNLRSFAGRQAKVCTIPRLLNDVYDFRGLLDIDGHLFGLESPDSGTVDSPGPSTEATD